MKELESTALRNATELRRLNSRIGETLKHRSSSPEGLAAWETACAEFHDRFYELSFPGGESAWLGFMRGDIESVEPALAFLAADPWFIRSGYLKQTVWLRLKRMPLSTGELRRLEQIALDYLPRRIRQEFWHMAHFVCLRGGDTFWETVQSLAASPTRSPGAIKAGWLMLLRAHVPVRRLIARELRRAKYQSGHVPDLDLAYQWHETWRPPSTGRP